MRMRSALDWSQSRRANLILRCFTARDPLVLMKAFNPFVRPIVEYATVVWNPSAKMSIRRIEAVLKRFTKRLHGLHNLSYNARLETPVSYTHLTLPTKRIV